jgi:hypothetical protein
MMSPPDEEAPHRFVRPTPTPIRDAWPSEPRDFTPWLAENLDLLDVLEIGRLGLVDTEVTLPGTSRALDLLAELSDGRRVAIENQFGVVDHDHLTRALAYAVGLQATESGVAAMVLIAEQHLPEFVAIADYLNRAAEQLGESGLPVFLVRVKVDTVEQYWVPRFEVVARPNDWRAGVAEQLELRSPEELLDRMDTASRATAAALLADWEVRPGATIGHKARNAVAFYLKNPFAKAGKTAVFVQYGDGSFVINVGYMVDSGAFSDDEAEELLAEVLRMFPDHTTGEKRYFFNGRLSDVAQAIRFADWLTPRLDLPS